MKITIRTPEQRLRVYVSSTLHELSEERTAIKNAILDLNLIPVMFEEGARPYPLKDLYAAYMQQSHIFIGLYWEEDGRISGQNMGSTLTDEFNLSAGMPRLIYIKNPANNRAPELNKLIDQISSSGVSYRSFHDASELKDLVINDLTILLTERFELSLEGYQTDLESDKLNENFPIPTSPIIGRKKAILDILDLIYEPTYKLITISGVGGIGKTRLGLELLRHIKSEGQMKVCFVPLSSVSDYNKVGEQILRTAFPNANLTTSAEQLLIQLIGDKHILLLLDNFEHLIQSRLLISNLLQNSPHLKIIITSRELLHISGEFEYGLAPLPYDMYNEELDSVPASLELFVQRAKAILPHFTLSNDNYESIREICKLLDGIPLAIELAAARVRLLSPAQILNLLNHNLDFLKSDHYDTPLRHQTLRSTVDWSFKLLNDEEQRVLCLLSVFSGGGTLEAAAIMAVDSVSLDDIWEFPREGFYKSKKEFPPLSDQVSEVDFLEVIESLLSKSLAYTSVNKYGVLRVNFYQTIQYYCQDKLREFELLMEAQYRHLFYFLYLTESLWHKLKSEEAYESYELLDNDIHNIEKAMHNSIKLKPELGLRIAIAMSEYWDTRGDFKQTQKWIERLLDSSPQLEKTNFHLWAIARLELARALFRLADFDKAWQILEECRVCALALKEDYILADVLILKTLINVYAHRNEQKEDMIKEGLSLTRKLNYDMALLDAIQHKAADRIFGGAVDQGIPIAIESLKLAQTLKAKRWEAIAYLFLGFGYFWKGSLGNSAFHFKSVLECTSALSDQLLPVYALLGLSQITLIKQDMEMTGLLLGTVDTFIHKPGINLVPIVLQIHTSLLEKVRELHNPELLSSMEKGRKMRINDMIDLVLEKEILMSFGEKLVVR